MEQNFQTSFIPKKPMVRESVKYSRPIGFFTVVALFVLLTVVPVTGAFYFYKGVVKKNIETMSNTLALAKKRFEPAKITELQVLDKRLHGASEVLAKHIVITPIFKDLQRITMKTVRYTKFNYTYTGAFGDTVKVSLAGVASGYSHLALQSDLYGEDKNFISPVFSNLTLNEAGNVVFNLDFSVDPSFVDYKLTLQTKEKENNVESLLDIENAAADPEEDGALPPAPVAPSAPPAAPKPPASKTPPTKSPSTPPTNTPPYTPPSAPPIDELGT